MATYLERYKEAKAKGETKVVTPDYVEFKKKGDCVVGMLKGIATVESPRTGKAYNQYLVLTDKGLVKFALGNATDNELRDIAKRGKVYAFTFQGKEDLGGGRSVNKFLIELLDIDDEEPPMDEDDIPF